jgi:hypothetical protein
MQHPFSKLVAIGAKIVAIATILEKGAFLLHFSPVFLF